MRSLHTRLLALWLMLAVSGAVIGFLLLEFYQQSANAQLSRAEERVARSCRDLVDRYAFFVTGWRDTESTALDDDLRQRLTGVVAITLAHASGVEGGIWHSEHGSLAYAFPTYEGTGPKTDLPIAEAAAIQQVNADALRQGRPTTVRQFGRSQSLVIHACPLAGPLQNVTGWTMTRIFTGQGPAYNQLLTGLSVLGLMVLGSAIWLGWSLYSWSRRVTRLEIALADHDAGNTVLPMLPATGEQELDRLVEALNATGVRLADERVRAASAERMAAVGRLAAGLAHEIRNPISAMRLKAENALAVDDGVRRTSALQFILDQVDRLDGLLHDLLATTQRKEPQRVNIDLGAFLAITLEPHQELAAEYAVRLKAAPFPPTSSSPVFDPDQMRRAMDNLILNAIQNTPSGGVVTVEADCANGILYLRVRDTGRGVPERLRERLFEPFVTGRAEGTGLGLAIVREIARAHGGDVRLAPTPSGAIFQIELPWQPF